MNKKYLIIAILIILLSLVLTIISNIFNFDFGLSAQVKEIENSKNICINELNGTWKEVQPLLFQYECYSYDLDGYKFYWHIDENGRYYKTK